MTDHADGGSSLPVRCCEQLRAQVELVCDMHPTAGTCGDYLIGYSPKFDEYGLWVHDGEGGSAHSWIEIQHCPFCGARLPPSRRDQWFDLLETRGVEPEDAGVEVQGYGWWIEGSGPSPA